ncbi:hypothetical protein BEH93_25780 [Streptomyces sp. 2R]|nr:hypothetical protein BEH93_25780 [Streptomyces sp. 2R]
MRTKPTMSKKSLRSVLAVAFSAGLVSVALGALSPEGIGADSAVAVRSSALPPVDMAWDSAPAKQAGMSIEGERGPDMGWDFAPTETDRA